jgi:hypothetical protein
MRNKNAIRESPMFSSEYIFIPHNIINAKNAGIYNGAYEAIKLLEK